jgi:transposase-like protein
MNEIPQTLIEAVRYFSVAANCNDFMREIKWPGGKITCPTCGNDSCVELASRPGTLKCNNAACTKRQFSYKVGTIFEDSPLGLDKWFCAVWSIANCKNGISSHELGRAIGVTQRTAWFMLHRIRKAMESNDFRKLDGEIESDETYVGGRARNMHKKAREKKITGRGGTDKTPVQCIVQRDLECSQARTFVVKATDAETLVGNIMRNVEKDSAVYTDENTANAALGVQYDHSMVCHSEGEFVRGRSHINGAENFFTLLKRAIKGTYVAVAPWHLARYCHEQGFRFNFRQINDAGRFLNALRGVLGKRLTYRELAAVGDAGFMGIK